MSIATYNLTKRGQTDNRIVQGSDWSVTLSVIGDPSSWEFFAARAQLRADFKDSAPVIVARMTAMIIDPTPNQQVVQVSLNNATSAAITEVEGRWDVELFSDDDTYVRRVIQGGWSLSNETTST